MIILIGHGHSVLGAISVAVKWYGTIIQAYAVRFNVFVWIIRPVRLLNGRRIEKERERAVSGRYLQATGSMLINSIIDWNA